MKKEIFEKIFEEELNKYLNEMNSLNEIEDTDIIKVTGDVEDTEDSKITFESDPLGFILKSYPELKETLETLMSEYFLEYITGIYIIAPLPTTFKIVLHNNQFYYITFMGKGWMAKIAGKKYYLNNINEKGSATKAIARLLALGGSAPATGATPDQAAPETTSTSSGGGGGENPFGFASGGGETEEAPAEEAPAEEEQTEEEPIQENLLTEGVIMKLLLKEAEATKGKATIFETALVMAWWALHGKEMPAGSATEKDIKAVTPQMLEDAKSILQQTGLDKAGEARQLTTASISKFWESHGASDKTTKADLIIGKYAISLKVGSAQLMSGAAGETTATLYAALENVKREDPGTIKAEVDKLAADLKTAFVRGTTKQGNVRQEKKRGDNVELNKALEAMNKVNKDLVAFFETNQDFLEAFAKEAASGRVKFGGGLGTATHVLTISPDYSKGKLNLIDDNYAKKLAKNTKMDITMKSNSEKIKKVKTGQYIYYSVLRAKLPDLFNVEDVKASVEVPLNEGGGCGCSKPKAPLLTESTNASILSENVLYHILNKLPITENTFRYGSKAFLDLWKEVRMLHETKQIELCGTDLDIINETSLGEVVKINGEIVPLDLILEEKEKTPALNKPKRGGSKAYYVYVRDPKTKKIKKVSFGSSGLKAKINNPKARQAFAKRHRCSEKTDKTKPSYWSCRLPRYASLLGMKSSFSGYW